MHLNKLWLTNFRNYENLEVEFPQEGLTVIAGSNGQGKTNILEAISFASSQRSFRVSHVDALIRSGATSAVVRAEANRAGRSLLVESEINSTGRNRTLINKQNIRSTDTYSRLLVTVFAPDDLDLIKGGPSLRRNYLDQLLADMDPRLEALQRELDRIIRQRNTLLRQAGGRATPEVLATLDVWDTKYAQAGEQLGKERRQLVGRITSLVQDSYRRIVDEKHGMQSIGLVLQDEWSEAGGGLGLARSLEESRKVDLTRAVTTVGPHRDELLLMVNNKHARTHASQGEQRSLALALRFAGHELLTQVAKAPPLLLLDDVLSELDRRRSQLLLNELPVGQVFLTTAIDVPGGIEVAKSFAVSSGILAGAD